MSHRQSEKNVTQPWEMSPLSLNLSRRDLMGWAGKGAAGLAALSLLPGGAQTANRTRLGRLLPSVRVTGAGERTLSADTPAFVQQLPLWGDGANWNQPEYYETLQLADIDGDGQDELIIRGPQGILVERFDSASGQWIPLAELTSNFTDAALWKEAKYYKTIHCADIDGDGAKELIARDGVSIIAYKYDAASQTFAKLPNGPDWGDAAGWDKPEYYETIQFGDVDGDGKDEMIGRSSFGIETFQFFPNLHVWAPLDNHRPPWTDNPANSPDNTPWAGPQYYSTIRLADVDGDGAAELLGRSAQGVEVWKYTGSWNQIAALPLSDAGGWDQYSWFATFQCADVDGDGKAETLCRNVLGMFAWKFNPDTQGMDQVGFLPTSDAGGWNQPSWYGTFQCADIDGDGKAELLGRNYTGMFAWKYNPDHDDQSGNRNKQTWDQVAYLPDWSDVNQWDQVEYYATIRLGDVDGDGKAELIGRDKYSVQTWRNDAASGSWNRASSVFPDFTSDAVSPSVREAYSYINTALRGPRPVGEFRSVYYNLALQVKLPLWITQLQIMGPPPGVTPDDWTTVNTQIQKELGYAIDVNGWYAVGDRLINETFLSDTLTFQSVGSAGLNIASNSTATTVLSILALVTNVASTVLGVPDGYAAVAAAAGLLSTAFGLISDPLPHGGASYQEAYNQLPSKLNEAFNAALTGNGDAQEAAMRDYGLMKAISALVTGGQWQVDDDQLAVMVTASQRSYETSLYRMLIPLAWKIYSIGFPYKPDDRYKPYMLYKGGGLNYEWTYLSSNASSGNYPTSIPLETLVHVFNPPPSTPPRVGEPLGQSVQDALTGKNGWSIPVVSNDQAIWTPAPDLLLRAALARDGATGHIAVTLTVENAGFGPATPVTNVEIVGAKLGRANALTSLPRGRTRLAENQSQQVRLHFPMTAGGAGQTAVLQVRGKYKGGSFGGSFRVKLP